MKETDIAWAAGFFDGEGTVDIAKRINYWVRKSDNTKQSYEYYVLRVRASQVDLEPLIKLQNWFGGSINKRDKQGVASWEAQGPKAEIFLEGVLPYLTVKKIQASLALEYRKTLIKHKTRRWHTKETLEAVAHVRDLIVKDRQSKSGLRYV